MSFDTALTALVGIVSLFLGVLVLFSNRKDASNRLFFAFNISAAVWVFSSLAASFSDISHVRPYISIGFGATSLLVYFFLMFCITFPQNSLRRYWRIVLLILPLIFLSFSFLGLIAVPTLVGDNSFKISPGLFYVPYFLFLLFYVIASISMLIINYRKSSGTTKDQIRYILIGSSIYAFLALLFSLIMPLITHLDNIYRWGIYSVIIYLIFTAYGIINRGFLNIRVILTEAAVTIIIIAILVLVMTSEDANRALINGIIFIVASYGGYLVIASVRKEIYQRKQIQKLADDLKKANEHLKDLDKLKDDFLSIAAHELNTPLAAIEGYLSMILEEHIGGEVPPKIKKYLESMFTSSKRLSAIIHDMLNVSRIESGRIHLVYVETQIEDVINQSITEIMSKAKEKKHTLVFVKPARELPKTWFDLTRITEVMINLIGNAIKYTNPGGKIEVSTSADDKFITVSVKDNGRGIPEDRKKVVFDKFSQVDILRDEVKGTGLGMYIAKKFIELHKGKIWFDSSVSENDHGTTFYFTLPILKEKPFDPHEGEGEVLH